ncbi:MAG TPA: aminotransferase class I/II-fold pyridoxal phosphate-dependent enzyme [Holophagaceae bacterium]|nr:aminotransferase class I/II-fold pyridoxal phosphate-dependent enzyme [Holophagaceae bacterium]
MPLSRRAFLATLGAGGAASLALSGRGREPLTALPPHLLRPADRALAKGRGMIRLDSNENPNGPGERVFEAFRGAFGEANRYPFALENDLKAAIAKAHGIRPEHVLLACGSTEVLKVAVQTFTSLRRPLVFPTPSFEFPAVMAELLGHPVRRVPVDAKLRLDLTPMAEAAQGAGLVFFCNPNNPTATVQGKAEVAAFAAQVAKTSPETVILMDEAYHEYVEDPAYATAIPLALQNPNVIVSRTFSKVFGLAGLRVGYALGRPETLARLDRAMLPSGINQLALAGATLAIGDAAHIAEEQRRNREAKAFTRAWFEKAGYPVGPSEANFLMIDIRRDVKTFKAACLKQGVAVGRPFPPLNTHLRLSIGTRAEMEAALEVFQKVLV